MVHQTKSVEWECEIVPLELHHVHYSFSLEYVDALFAITMGTQNLEQVNVCILDKFSLFSIIRVVVLMIVLSNHRKQIYRVFDFVNFLGSFLIVWIIFLLLPRQLFHWPEFFLGKHLGVIFSQLEDAFIEITATISVILMRGWPFVEVKSVLEYLWVEKLYERSI